jgi:hypothetical protein
MSVADGDGSWEDHCMRRLAGAVAIFELARMNYQLGAIGEAALLAEADSPKAVGDELIRLNGDAS